MIKIQLKHFLYFFVFSIFLSKKIINGIRQFFAPYENNFFRFTNDTNVNCGFNNQHMSFNVVSVLFKKFEFTWIYTPRVFCCWKEIEDWENRFRKMFYEFLRFCILLNIPQNQSQVSRNNIFFTFTFQHFRQKLSGFENPPKKTPRKLLC
jgi:hypothetical protein